MLLNKRGWRRAAFSVMLIAALVTNRPPGRAQAQPLNTILQNLIQNAIPQNGSPAPNPYRPGPQGNPYVLAPPTYAPPASAYQTPPPATAATVQRMLAELGYDAGSANGVWGRRSEQALRAFEADHGQAPDGRLTAASERAVRDAWAQGSSTSLRAVPQPSFPCAHATAPAEVTICRDASLATLDKRLATAYGIARTATAGDAGANLAEQQSAWLQRRNACGPDAGCLRRAMTDRIAELQSGPLAGSSTSAGRELAPDTALGIDPLASLAAPPAELRLWGLQSVNGRLVISDKNPRPQSADLGLPQGDRFFRLIAESGGPGLLEDETDIGFLASLFTDEAGRAFFGPGGTWAGHNEIERARSRDAYRERGPALIRQMTPKLPLQLRWVETVLLGEYDTARGGFSVRPMGIVGGGPESLTRGQLGLLSSLHHAELKSASPVEWPDLFWPVESATAAQILRKWPDRAMKLFAVADLGTIDPGARELSVKLARLALYTPELQTKLYDYPFAPDHLATSPASPAGAAVSTPDAEAEAARRWKLPMLAGLPWIDGQSGNIGLVPTGSGFGGDFGFNATSGLRPLSPPELWTRAILALALGAMPSDAPVTNREALGLSCVLLSHADQVKVFKQRSCGTELLMNGKEFALKDGADAFRATEVPRLRAEAPHLPFTLLLVFRVEVGKYDTTRTGFPLGKPPGGELRLFNTPLDVPLPDFWPATEAEARRFLAPASGFRSAFFGLKITITGVIPGQHGPNIPETGLPNRATLRFRTDRIALYQDAGVQLILHDFTPQMDRLPQPILGTAEEKTPPAVDAIPLTPETALMMALHTGPPPGDVRRRKAAANIRQFSEKDYASREDWRDFDPWGVFFPPGADSAAAVDQYQQWTRARVAALPQTVTLSRLVSPWPINGPMHVFTDNSLGEFIGFGSTGSVDRSGSLHQALLSRGIDPANVLQNLLYIAGDQRTPVLVALPQAPSAYGADTKGALATPAPAGAPQARVMVFARLDGLEALPPDGSGRTIFVLRLTPEQAVIRRGTVTLVTMPLDGPHWMPVPRDVSVAERLAGPAYGVDILGIRLGMTIADAETLVRSALHVTREVDTVPQPPPAGAISMARQMLRGKLFLDDDSKQAIALFDAPKGADGRVIAVWRTAPVPIEAWDDLLARLIEKYRQPTRKNANPREAAWFNRFTPTPTAGDCSRGLADGQLTWLDGKEQKTPGGFSGWIGDFPTTPEVALHLDEFAGCGPALRVRNMRHAPGDPNAPLEMQLFDLGVLSELSRAPPPKPQSPTIRF